MQMRSIRSLLLLSAISGIFPAHHAAAQSPDRGAYQIAQAGYAVVLSALEQNGYRVVEMKTTFLGRQKILAKNRLHMREVVVSRSTGEIKSDRIIAIFANDKRGGSNTNGAVASVGVSVGVGGVGGGVSAGVSAGTGGVSAGGSTGSGGVSGGASAGSGGVSAGASAGGASAGASAGSGGVSADAGVGGISVGGGLGIGE
jgi:hypothetical protein